MEAPQRDEQDMLFGDHHKKAQREEEAM